MTQCAHQAASHGEEDGYSVLARGLPAPPVNVQPENVASKIVTTQRNEAQTERGASGLLSLTSLHVPRQSPSALTHVSTKTPALGTRLSADQSWRASGCT